MGKHGDAMPKLRQPARDPFKPVIDAIWPYLLGEQIRNVANILGVSRTYLYRKQANPKSLTLEDIDMLQRIGKVPKALIAESLPWHSDNELSYVESEIIRYVRAFPEVKDELLKRIEEAATPRE